MYLSLKIIGLLLNCSKAASTEVPALDVPFAYSEPYTNILAAVCPPVIVAAAYPVTVNVATPAAVATDCT